MLNPKLLPHILNRFALDWSGIHGVPHWERVAKVGASLAQQTNADEEVVQLFAVLHDACRLNEGEDDSHGERASCMARELNGVYYDLDPHPLDQLLYAIAHHHKGMTCPDPTIGTCWDADRLDLWRVGVNINPRFLSTEAAKERVKGFYE